MAVSEMSNERRGKVCTEMTFFFLMSFAAVARRRLDVHAHEFLVEEELSEGGVAFNHLPERGGFAGEVALSLVLLIQEIAS